MMNKNQKKQSTDAQDPNGELISTVTATVLQILKTTDQISGESKESKNSRKEPETVDLTGMLFCILERFWVVLVSAALCGTLMGMTAKNNVTTYSRSGERYCAGHILQSGCSHGHQVYCPCWIYSEYAAEIWV